MLDILLFIFLGLAAGTIFGLVPGLHPNMIVLFTPVLAALNLQPLQLIALVVSIGVSNVFLDFIPSMLFGAAEGGKELAVLPAHRMLLTGNGYDAVKLAVIGGLGSIIFVTVLLPALIFAVPAIYQAFRPVTYALLIFIAAIMIFSEKTARKKAVALFCFLLAGSVGLLASSLPADRTLVLFPILSGLFGLSVLLFSAKQKIKVPKRKQEIHVSGRQQRRSVIFGGAGGLVAGLLPGVGSSEIASLASVDKNEKSFIMTLGAIAASNTLLSVLALWLIGKSRSGTAVVLEQLVPIGFNELIFITAVALFVAALSALVTLKIAKSALAAMEKINYAAVSRAVIVMIIAMTVLFTGIYGLLLLTTCAALGVFANLSGIRRSVLMGVLILPTILFYLPF